MLPKLNSFCQMAGGLALFGNVPLPEKVEPEKSAMFLKRFRCGWKKSLKKGIGSFKIFLR